MEGGYWWKVESGRGEVGKVFVKESRGFKTLSLKSGGQRSNWKALFFPRVTRQDPETLQLFQVVLQFAQELGHPFFQAFEFRHFLVMPLEEGLRGVLGHNISFSLVFWIGKERKIRSHKCNKRRNKNSLGFLE